jgi:phosphotransferase system HPr-like phosphotransfer protein
MYERVIVIRLSDIEEVRDFVRAARACEHEIDVKYNRVLIDAKSLLGMIGVGMSKDIQVCCGEQNTDFERAIAKYQVGTVA